MSEQAQPGWYPDPWGGAEPRWWDGAQWTAHVGVSPLAAPTAPAAPAAAVPASPGGVPVLNPWIWLVVFAPYVSLLVLPFMRFPALPPVATLDDPDVMIQWQLEFFLDPAFVIAMVLGWAGTIVAIVAAHRDWKVLTAAGLERPFHWAFVFLNLAVGPVYAIGRAVVVRQRTGRGLAVLWATIGALLVAVVVAIIWGTVVTIDLVTRIMEMVGT